MTRVWSGAAVAGSVRFVLDAHPQQLAWGAAKNGLRAAVEFQPAVAAGATKGADDSIPLGGRADARIHLQNVGQKDISLWSETWRQSDTVFRVEAGGKETQLSHSWYSGWPTMQHWTLKPGQSAVIAAIGVAAAHRR